MKKIINIGLLSFSVLILGGVIATVIYFYPMGVGIYNISKGARVAVSKSGNRKIVNDLNDSWVKINCINRTAVSAIVISEDWAFYQHQGIDYNQLTKAIKNSVLFGKKLRGASTISQQVVKNLFFTNDRSFGRKISEAILTNYLESSLSKNKILEVYLNIIEFGENIYGIKDAASFYFKKEPSMLTAREGAFLAMLLPRPKTYAISFKNRELSPYAFKIVNEILEKLKKAHVISDVELFYAKLDKFSWEI